MTPEEAIHELGILAHYEVDSGPRGDGYRQAIQMAIKALDKDIPKMPIPATIDDGFIVNFKCPACGELGVWDDICEVCGQFLDWASLEKVHTNNYNRR